MLASNTRFALKQSFSRDTAPISSASIRKFAKRNPSKESNNRITPTGFIIGEARCGLKEFVSSVSQNKAT